MQSRRSFSQIIVQLAVKRHFGPTSQGETPKQVTRYRLRNARRQRGFTLIEAVVAMVLISGAGAALFAWINSELSGLSRVQQSNARAAVMVNVIEFMQTVNPMLAPEGKVSLARYSVAWKATAVTAVQDPANLGLFQLALYDNYVTVQQADGTRWFNFTLRQVGYKKVRDRKPAI